MTGVQPIKKHLTKSRTPSVLKRHWGTTIQQRKSSSKPMPPQQALGLPYCKTNADTDALSRLPSDEAMPIPDLNVQIHDACPQFSNGYLQKIQEETLQHPELAALKEVVFNGWPNNIKELPPALRPYWNYREEISIENSLIMKRHRIIIPQVLQGDILAKLHASHQGTEKTNLRARTSVFWKNLNKDIEEMTKSCKVCQELQPNQQREPLLQTEIPPRPWHTIGTDLFTLTTMNTF